LKTQAPTLEPIKVEGPLVMVGMDIIGKLPETLRGYRYVLTVTDYFTKYVEFFPLKDKKAEGVCQAIRSFIYR
jgi:hypothetical protein